MGMIIGKAERMKNFSDLSQQELLALAIALEEEDNRTYSDLAEALRETYPGTARMFVAMAEEEDGHRPGLLDLYREKFGDHIPLIRRHDIKGFLERKSLWLSRPLGLEKVRAQAELMEAESKRFYLRAALDRRREPSALGRPRGEGASARDPGRRTRVAICAGRGREGRGRGRATPVPLADRPVIAFEQPSRG
jgi:rubrerythrin